MPLGAEQLRPEVAGEPENKERREKLRQHFEDVRDKLVLKYEWIVKGDQRLLNPLLGTALAGSSVGENNHRPADNFTQLRQKIEELCEEGPLKNSMLLELRNIEAGTPRYYDDVK